MREGLIRGGCAGLILIGAAACGSPSGSALFDSTPLGGASMVASGGGASAGQTALSGGTGAVAGTGTDASAGSQASAGSESGGGGAMAGSASGGMPSVPPATEEDCQQ